MDTITLTDERMHGFLAGYKVNGICNSKPCLLIITTHVLGFVEI